MAQVRTFLLFLFAAMLFAAASQTASAQGVDPLIERATPENLALAYRGAVSFGEIEGVLPVIPACDAEGELIACASSMCSSGGRNAATRVSFASADVR